MYRFIRSDIYRTRDDKLDIVYDRQDNGGITTHRGKGRKGDPFVTHDSSLNGHIVYSVYKFTGDQYVDIYKDLKKDTDKPIDSSVYYEWVVYTAQYIWDHILSKHKPDVIALPETSSHFLTDVVSRISLISGIDYLPKAFKKNPVEDIIIQVPDGVEVSDSYMKSVQRALERIRAKGVFESKSVSKPMLKFFRNIYTDDDDYIDFLHNKVVAVIDDSMSSKTTMANIFDVCDYLYETADAYGVTVFKK